MGQPKYLNLDEIAPETERMLKLGGNDYPIVMQTVGMFIKSQKIAEQIDELGSEAEKMESYIDMLGDMIPTIEIDLLMKLTFDQLHTIAEFARGEMDEETKAELIKQTEAESQVGEEEKKP